MTTEELKTSGTRLSKESVRAAPDVPGLIGSALADRIRKHGLEGNIAELDVEGYTVVENVGSPEFLKELRTGIIELATEDERDGRRSFGFGPNTRVVYNLLGQVPEVEQALLNPILITVMTHLLGDGYTANLVSGSVFREGTLAGPVHSDNEFHPEPFPTWPAIATAIWCCDEFTQEKGATQVVPGSHRFHRHPRPGEGEDRVRCVAAPPGSIIVWNGNTWHSSGARTSAGERVALHTSFCRMHIRSFQSFAGVPQEVFDRNPPELSRILGRDLPFGFSADGPDPKKMSRAKTLVRSQLDGA